MLKQGSVLSGRYEIQERIGLGGMAIVFRAVDLKLGRTVAVKELKEEYVHDTEFIEKFRHEAIASASLLSPNLVAIYDAIDEGDDHCIIMEYVEGITLKNYIQKKQGRLSNDETIEISMQVLSGIREAHRQGIIHRDIKPQNMIISTGGRVKVADFGIARTSVSEHGTEHVLGSAHYIAPEQALSGEADERSDLYSMGITMYEMITGRLPFDAEEADEIIRSQLEDTLVPPKVYNPEIWPALNDIILKAAKKQPEMRYQSADEFIADLKRCQEDHEGHFVRLFEAGSPDPENHGSRRYPKEPSQEAGRSRSRQNLPDTLWNRFYNRYHDVIKANYFRLMFVFAVLALGAIYIMFIRGSFRHKEPGVIQNTVETTAAVTAEQQESLTLTIEGANQLPSVQGMSLQDASELLSSMGLGLDAVKHVYSNVINEGFIIDQSPAAGESFREGDTVIVTVSLGSRISAALRNIRGLGAEEAARELKDAGLTVSEERLFDFSDEVPEELVITASGYDPGTNTETEIREGGTVRLIVSRGREDAYVRVPKLVMLTLEQAQTIASEGGLVIGTVTGVPVSGVQAGLVTAQSLEPDSQVRRGSVLDLSVAAEEPGGQAEPNHGGVQEDQLSPDYYYANVDVIATIGAPGGPSESAEQVDVFVRLKQRVGNVNEYSMIEDVMPVKLGSRLPLNYTNIRGVYGVDTGEIEIVNAVTGDVYSRYPVSFYPLG